MLVVALMYVLCCTCLLNNMNINTKVSYVMSSGVVLFYVVMLVGVVVVLLIEEY